MIGCRWQGEVYDTEVYGTHESTLWPSSQNERAWPHPAVRRLPHRWHLRSIFERPYIGVVNSSYRAQREWISRTVADAFPALRTAAEICSALGHSSAVGSPITQTRFRRSAISSSSNNASSQYTWPRPSTSVVHDDNAYVCLC